MRADNQLRFAALIRVSTDRQAKEGESLAVQRTAIAEIVKRLGGRVEEWYGGQEHATSRYEKPEIARLLEDVQKKGRKCDAVIVTNADRWSRDNQSSHIGLDIFRKHGIRFFVGGTEYDLFQPEHALFLEMSATFGSFQARQQKMKSLSARIHAAKRGVPSCGKLPYGRIYDRATGKWSIDSDKQRKMRDVAQRYIAGEGMSKLAEELGANHATLWKTLTKRCGAGWEIEFNVPDLKIQDKVKVPGVPPLLPQGLLDAVLARGAANKTYHHGQLKHKYLLGRMVCCAHCGYALFGQTNHNKLRYYRHAHTKRVRPCNATKTWIPADALEEAVVRHLFATFGNPAAVERAIEGAIPDLNARRQLEERLEQIEKRLKDERAGRAQVVRFMRQRKISEAEADKELDESSRIISQLEGEQQKLLAKMPNAPTPEQIRGAAEYTSRKFKRKRLTVAELKAVARADIANRMYSEMTWEEKRELLTRVFAGKYEDGSRAAVYIEWRGPKKPIRYSIRGLLTLSDRLPTDGKLPTIDPDGPLTDPVEEGVTRLPWH